MLIKIVLITILVIFVRRQLFKTIVKAKKKQADDIVDAEYTVVNDDD